MDSGAWYESYVDGPEYTDCPSPLWRTPRGGGRRAMPTAAVGGTCTPLGRAYCSAASRCWPPLCLDRALFCPELREDMEAYECLLPDTLAMAAWAIASPAATADAAD